MKVFDLQCEHGHGFEGWFDSEEEHLRQSAAGLVECPLCGSPRVERLPSAPRLNLSGVRPAAAGEARSPATPEQQSVDALWLRAVRHVMEHTEDVGRRFADEARRIHHGESPARGIRGETSPDERQALREEGIEVHSLPVPVALKGPSH